MNYRDRLYAKYVSEHTHNLYGEMSLSAFRGQFVAWESYFGRFLPLDKSARILDVGCGNGGLVFWLHGKGFAHTSGIDISKEQVDLAKRLGIRNVFHAQLQHYLTDKEHTYDFIFLRDVIEHFTKDAIISVLDLIYSALTPGGAIIIQTPNAESPFSGRHRYGDFTHETSFTRSSISQVLGVIGFQKATVHSMPPVVHGIKSSVRWLLWRCIELVLCAYLLVETGSWRGIFSQNLIVYARKGSNGGRS
jgi:2-polyprenyl-3-methyl-5-hydroxy-6-metoxy-1,4-benzoquinol methylase